MNATDVFNSEGTFEFPTLFKVTEQCFEWCQEQFNNYEHNQQTEIMISMMAGLIILFVSQRLKTHENLIVNNTPLTHNHIEMIASNVNLAGFIVMTGTLIYYLIFL